MDALVHQRAAVVLPGAAPGGRVEIGFVAVAAHLSRRVKEPSEGAAVRRGLHGPNGGGEAQLMIDAQAHAVFFLRGDHGVGVLQREGDGLFHDHVRPGLHAVAGDAALDPAAQRQRCELGPDLLEHAPVVGVHGRSGALFLGDRLKDLPCGGLVDVAERGDLQTRFQSGFYMVRRDHTAADKSVFHSVTSLSTSQIFSAACPSPKGR